VHEPFSIAFYRRVDLLPQTRGKVEPGNFPFVEFGVQAFFELSLQLLDFHRVTTSHFERRPRRKDRVSDALDIAAICPRCGSGPIGTFSFRLFRRAGHPCIGRDRLHAGAARTAFVLDIDNWHGKRGRNGNVQDQMITVVAPFSEPHSLAGFETKLRHIIPGSQISSVTNLVTKK
jgi:hypothetical protein